LLALSARLKPCPCYKAPSQRSLQTRALVAELHHSAVLLVPLLQSFWRVYPPRVFLQVFENKRQQEPVGCKCLILKRKIASVSFQGSCCRPKGLKSMPQGLKPLHFIGLIGPAKAVPLLQSPITAQPANSCPSYKTHHSAALLVPLLQSFWRVCPPPVFFCKCLKINDSKSRLAASV
jgi:hypothetical protein